MGLYPKGIVAYPTKTEKWATKMNAGSSWWPENPVVYRWPTVVIEPMYPSGMKQILVDVDGQLGSINLSGGRRLRRERLKAAGFHIIEVAVWGWESPRAVPPGLLGAHASEVPASVLGRIDYWPHPRLLS